MVQWDFFGPSQGCSSYGSVRGMFGPTFVAIDRFVSVKIYFKPCCTLSIGVVHLRRLAMFLSCQKKKKMRLYFCLSWSARLSAAEAGFLLCLRLNSRWTQVDSRGFSIQQVGWTAPDCVVAKQTLTIIDGLNNNHHKKPGSAHTKRGIGTTQQHVLDLRHTIANSCFGCLPPPIFKLNLNSRPLCAELFVVAPFVQFAPLQAHLI